MRARVRARARARARARVRARVRVMDRVGVRVRVRVRVRVVRARCVDLRGTGLRRRAGGRCFPPLPGHEGVAHATVCLGEVGVPKLSLLN